MDFPPNTTAFDADIITTKAHPELAAAGFDTIFRYIAIATRDPDKVVKPAEAKSMQAHGLKLALIYESTAERVLSGAAGGKADGAFSASYAPSVGVPPGIGAAIYPTADFDLQLSQLATAMSYLRAFAAACPGYDLGFYANGLANDEAFSQGIIKYRWITQSMGFTGTRSSLEAGRYEIVQRLPTKVCGLDVDPDSLREPGLEIGARVPFAVPVAAKPESIVQRAEDWVLGKKA